MASATTLSNWDAALKQYYRNKSVDDLVYKSHPLMELLPKDTKFRGRNMPIPIIYGRGQGVSSTFSTAQTNASASKVDDFLLTRVSKYGVATISGEAVAASEGDRYAFLSASTTEIDNIIKSVGDSIAKGLYGDGSGAIGQIASTTTIGSTSCDLEDPSTVFNFEVGMKLDLAASKTGGSVRSTQTTITAVDRSKFKPGDTDQLTASANWNANSGATGDYLYQEGDYDAVITGLDAWVPSSSPSSASFFGVDRSVDPTRLGGQRYDGSSDTIIEALIEGMAITAREGGHPDHIFLSFAEFVKLEKALGAQVKREVKRSDSLSGYDSLDLIGPSGTAKVIPDKDCADGVAYILEIGTWTLASIGEVVQLTQLDGNRVLRQASDDGIEVRVHSYAQLGCSAPGWNCRVTLPS